MTFSSLCRVECGGAALYVCTNCPSIIVSVCVANNHSFKHHMSYCEMLSVHHPPEINSRFLFCFSLFLMSKIHNICVLSSVLKKNVQFSHDFGLQIKRNPRGNKSLLCTFLMTLELQNRRKCQENVYLR